MGDPNWYCINSECGGVIGLVIGGELSLHKTVNPEEVTTSGPNLIVKCPRCGQRKIWFTSDASVRALNQLMDVMASGMAKIALRKMSREDLGQKT